MKSVTVKVAVVEWNSNPLEPVTVRVKVAAVAAEHDTLAVPDVVMLLGVMAPHVRPAGTVSVSETVPVNPPIGAIVIVELAD